jgi:hypothetical protein
MLDQIFLEVKKLHSDHSKRAAAVASLQQHEQNGSFPADLNFKMHEYQLPATIGPDKAEAYRKFCSDATIAYKKTLFDARLKIFSEDLAALKHQLDGFFVQDNFTTMVFRLFGNDAIVQTSIPELLAESRLKYSLFLREQRTRPVTPSRHPSSSDTMAVDGSNSDIALLLRRIEQLELNQRGTSSRNNRRASGPSSGNAERRGRSPYRQPPGQSASPLRHGRNTSRSRPIQQERYRSQRESSNSHRRQNQSRSASRNRSSGSRSPSRPRPHASLSQRNRPPTPRGGHGRGNRRRNGENNHHQRRQY